VLSFPYTVAWAHVGVIAGAIAWGFFGMHSLF
jgi:hypothetical protein